MEAVGYFDEREGRYIEPLPEGNEFNKILNGMYDAGYQYGKKVYGDGWGKGDGFDDLEYRMAARGLDVEPSVLPNDQDQELEQEWVSGWNDWWEEAEWDAE